MNERTLENEDLNVRKPSYEMQKEAILAGYSNVRDWVLDAMIEEIRELKGRVDQLEEKLPLHGELEP